MAEYKEHNWKNGGEDYAIPLSADNLNQMEAGIRIGVDCANNLSSHWWKRSKVVDGKYENSEYISSTDGDEYTEGWNEADERMYEYLGIPFENARNKVPITSGTYIGDREVSQFIDLGFTPSAVLVVMEDGCMTNSNLARLGGLAVAGHPSVGSGKSKSCEIVDNGFNVFYNSANNVYTNSNVKYMYIAIKHTL